MTVYLNKKGAIRRLAKLLAKYCRLTARNVPHHAPYRGVSLIVSKDIFQSVAAGFLPVTANLKG